MRSDFNKRSSGGGATAPTPGSAATDGGELRLEQISSLNSSADRCEDARFLPSPTEHHDDPSRSQPSIPGP